MQPRRLILLSSCFVLALAVLSPAAAYGKEGGKNRPLQAVSFSTTTVDVAGGTATGEGTSQVTAGCGRASFHDDWTFTLTGPDTFKLEGPGSWVCANGNELRYTAVVTGTVSTGKSTGDFKIAGGTGRFASATGSFKIEGQSTPVSQPDSSVMTFRDSNTVDGRISY